MEGCAPGSRVGRPRPPKWEQKGRPAPVARPCEGDGEAAPGGRRGQGWGPSATAPASPRGPGTPRSSELPPARPPPPARARSLPGAAASCPATGDAREAREPALWVPRPGPARPGPTRPGPAQPDPARPAARRWEPENKTRVGEGGAGAAGRRRERCCVMVPTWTPAFVPPRPEGSTRGRLGARPPPDGRDPGRLLPTRAQAWGQRGGSTPLEGRWGDPPVAFGAQGAKTGQ